MQRTTRYIAKLMQRVAGSSFSAKGARNLALYLSFRRQIICLCEHTGDFRLCSAFSCSPLERES
jgi:hypothetical protein